MGSVPAVRVANDELATVREAMRELNRLVDALERGELEKVVLTQRNQMRAVVVSLERFAELEREASSKPVHPRVGLSVARAG
jgi:PHD/YefM family antitoxin component YafN of YafNO toxin-antitoxin module